ncbi:32859_t:CDS:2, partial [Gigaspora margarita]
FQQDQQNVGTIRDRSVCQQVEYTATNVHVLASRPNVDSSKCIHTEVGSNEVLCKSPMDIDPENFSQGSEGASDDLYCDTSLEISNLVSYNNGTSNRYTPHSPIREFYTTRAHFGIPTILQQPLENVRVAYLRERLKEKGVSNEAIELSCKSLDPNSTSTVSSNLRIWTIWCSTNKKDSIRCPITDIMQFLTEKDREGKSYNTITSYRSAISEIHEEVDGVPVGRNKDIAKLMLGIFKTNPPKEPGDEIYDITPSLDYIVSLGNNDLLPLIALAKKTAFLCALSSASRPSDLARLDLTTINNTQNGVTLHCLNPKESNIALGHGISKKRFKKNFRTTKEQRTFIFLSNVGDHKPAAVDTIANWLKDIIKKSAPEGKAKDIRVLSALLAQNAGVDLNSILALGNWSNTHTYQRFYQRGIKLMLEQNNVTGRIMNQARSN